MILSTGGVVAVAVIAARVVLAVFVGDIVIKSRHIVGAPLVAEVGVCHVVAAVAVTYPISLAPACSFRSYVSAGVVAVVLLIHVDVVQAVAAFHRLLALLLRFAA